MFLKNLKVEVYQMELKFCLSPNLKEQKPYRFSKVTTVEEVERVSHLHSELKFTNRTAFDHFLIPKNESREILVSLSIISLVFGTSESL